ncbi:MAG: tRNA (adenine-N1)-methyltransferase [Candidatus Omnitrophica bacterium]|nr:tRNA (adenine-N1)-methyltransferase [Candidatus Omnitrophota bacterium]
MKKFKEGDVIGISLKDGKKWFVKIEKKTFGTHKGNINLEEIIGKDEGSEIQTNLGHKGYAFYPSLEEIILYYIRRNTQIAYPKDLGYIILKLGIKEGTRIIECGTGTGATTFVFSHFVGNTGKIYTYENREEFTQKAQKLIKEFGMEERVVFKTKDIIDGFDEKDADVLFLDIKNPQDYVEKVFSSLKKGGTFGIIVPTTNQVSDVLVSLERIGLVNVEVSEILLRKYKTNPARLRPDDIMIGHTVYIMTGRNLSIFC